MDSARGTAPDGDFAARITRAAHGDEDAFAGIWRSFNPRLLRFLRGMAGPEDAEDLASIVWMEVARGLDRFSGDESGFRAWLFTVARHRVIDLHRSRARRPIQAGDGSVDDIGDARVVDPASVAERDWSTARAVELIASLPPDQAEVILLRVVAGLDVGAVAEIVGKRPGTVRVLAHRGLRRLAATVTPHPDLEEA